MSCLVITIVCPNVQTPISNEVIQSVKTQAPVGTGMSRARNSRWGILLHLNEARIYGGQNKKGVHV